MGSKKDAQAAPPAQEQSSSVAPLSSQESSVVAGAEPSASIAVTVDTAPAEVVQEAVRPARKKAPADPSIPVSVHSQEIVAKFHDAFGHPVASVPAIPSDEHRLLRVRLIGEELAELAKASGVRLEVRVGYGLDLDGVRVRDFSTNMPIDIVEAADALADLDVVVAGSHCAWGTPGFALLMEVHESNMSKIGGDGAPIYDEGGKIQKGPNYFAPRIRDVLIAAGWQPPEEQS